ncbi:MAG: hypothetical protein JW928_09900 [Candidatus Aureabacteria bacterium]|nr:hypothetical protein [Candidatus Auribacterota bacterium]
MLTDIQAEYKSLQTDKKTIRNFGIVFFVALSLLALWLFFKGKESAWGFLMAGGIFLFFGIFYYPVLIPLYKLWMLLGIILGWFVSRLVLIFLFYFVFTPISLILKLIRKDILDEKMEKEKSSYWKKYDEPDDPEHYTKQF